MSMLLGAAKLLKAREGQLQGTVLLVFQPAEEGGAGAQAARLLLAAAGVDPLQQAACAAAAPAAAGSCRQLRSLQRLPAPSAAT